MVESTRGARRRRTHRIIRRRWRRHLRECAIFDGAFGITSEPGGAAAHPFARHDRHHRCAKRRPGRPKVGYGACHHGLREAGRARILTRRLERELIAGRVRPDEVLSPCGFHGLVDACRPVRGPGEKGPSPARTTVG